MAANQPPGGYPPPGGGYPPQGGGYPPQGGGYPPQQGGYPPQGYQPQAGYPPQAGFEPVHKRPGVVTAAAIIWIIYGSLQLLGSLMTLGASGGRSGTPTIVGLGIGVGLLVSGIQALMGKARGLLASGITSIVLGALVLIAFLALSSLIRGIHAPAALFAVIGLVFGGLLITSGILACMGNAKYKSWRQTKGL